MRRLFYSMFLFLLGGILTGSAQGQVLRFAFLTDIHVSPGTPAAEALQQIVQEINSDSLNFVILTGDLTNTGSDAELNTVKQTLDKLKIPCYAISGNHETNWSESAGATFIRLFGGDRFLFESGDYLFVGFATGPYMKMGDGHAKEEDIYWLQKELKKRDIKNKTLLVAVHYPLKDGLDNWYKITDVLNEFNARFVLCGHEHKLSLHNFDGIPGIMGRATVKSGSDVKGYNIITLRNDSVFITEKELGITSSGYFASFSLKNNDAVKNLPVSDRPDFSINKSYPSVSAPAIIQDSASIFTGVALGKDLLVYGNSKGEIIAWSTSRKQVLWRNQYAGSVYSTPSIYKKTVYAGTIDGNLYVLDLQTGKELNRLSLGKPIIGEATVDGDFLYATAGNDLYKIKAATGEILWKNTDVEGQLQGKPLVTANEIIFGAWDRHLYCLDKGSGKLIWKWDNGHQAVLYSPANVVPAVHDGKVFIVAPDRYMTAIDLRSGKTVWRTNKYRVRESMGISEDGKHVYAKLMNDSILSISAQGNEFKEEWVVDAGFGYEHNPCPVLEYKGIIYAGGRNGLLVGIDTRTHQVKFKHKCGNSAINKISPDGKEGVWLTLIEGKIMHVITSL